MPTLVVEEQTCDICGAEVREGSAFCFNCGGSLAIAEEPLAEPPVEVNGKVEAIAEGSAYDPQKRREEPIRPKRTRSERREPVVRVIEWQPERGTSIAFIVTSLIVFGLAIGIIFLAFYVQ